MPSAFPVPRRVRRCWLTSADAGSTGGIDRTGGSLRPSFCRVTGRQTLGLSGWLVPWPLVPALAAGHGRRPAEDPDAEDDEGRGEGLVDESYRVGPDVLGEEDDPYGRAGDGLDRGEGRQREPERPGLERALDQEESHHAHTDE